jgi:hypothetical protein
MLYFLTSLTKELNTCKNKMYMFCHITPCSPLKARRRFGGVCRLHFQVRRIRQERNQHEEASKQSHTGFLLGLFYDPEDEGDIVLRNIA